MRPLSVERRGRRSAAALVVLAALAASGCDGGTTAPDPITELPRALSAAERGVITAGNTFAVDLLAAVHEAAPDSTSFLSPLSASMALGMTMNGAAGATRDQMQAMLGYGGLTQEQVNAAYEDLIALLRGLDPAVDFRLANALFHRDTFEMRASFLDVVRSAFDARVQGLDFSDPAAAGVINAWVREATGGRITEIVKPRIDPLTMAFLMNAVYFKGDWRRAFDEKKTYSGPFHLADGTTRNVRFMIRDGGVGYRAGDGWEAVELPYGGGAWVMDVAVPSVGRGLDAVVGALGAVLDPDATWPDRQLPVHLPRFELAWERVLNDDLRALGMVDAFDDAAADFTAMYERAREEGLHVKEVKQKTFLKVDEKGTEAAAVTSVEVGIVSAPVAFRADRPFLLAIRERLSGTVLFAGLIVQAPTEG